MTDWEEEIARRERLAEEERQRIAREAEENGDGEKSPDVGHSGLVCLGCGCRDFRVYYVKHDVKNNRIKRSRICRHCGRRVITTESIVG